MFDTAVHWTHPNLSRSFLPLIENSNRCGIHGSIGICRHLSDYFELKQMRAACPKEIPFQFTYTLGYHPDYARQFPEQEQKLYRIVEKDPNVVAIGECGLDYVQMHASSVEQKEVLRAHVRLAETVHKPLFCSERQALYDVVRCVGRPKVPVFLHHISTERDEPWTNVLEKLNVCANYQYYIGVSTLLCKSRLGAGLRKAIREFGEHFLDFVLIESNSPFSVPDQALVTDRHANHLEIHNRPRWILEVLEELSHLLRVPIEEVERRVDINTRRCFGLFTYVP